LDTSTPIPYQFSILCFCFLFSFSSVWFGLVPFASSDMRLTWAFCPAARLGCPTALGSWLSVLRSWPGFWLWGLSPLLPFGDPFTPGLPPPKWLLFSRHCPEVSRFLSRQFFRPLSHRLWLRLNIDCKKNEKLIHFRLAC